MSEDDIDRLVGASRRRVKAAKRRVVCLKSKLDEMARTYRRLADLIEDPGRLVKDPSGHVAISGVCEGPALYHPEERNLLDTLDQYREAEKEFESATHEWERLDSC